MKKTKLLVTLMCIWMGLLPLAAQSVTITKELELNPYASAVVMFKNQFGKWEKPDLNDTFPYAVIRMRLEGNETEVRKAKERLTLYMGQLTAVVDRYTENSNEILFLVPARRPAIYIDCGDGCEQLLLSDMQQLRSNGVYYCTVHYQQSKEVIALEEEIALLKQRLEQLESGDVPKEETQKEESNNLQFNVNGVSFTMVKVNGGIVPSLPNQESDSLVLSDYYIGQTEVTQELWNAVMGYNPSEFHYTPQHPIETISWYEALEFICRLNQFTGETFDFPTQAEWTFAALEGTTSTNNTYSGSGDLLFLAWFDNNSSKSAHDVAKKNPNSLGLYDMTGNVAEWCYHHDKKYAIGGSWESSKSECAILTKTKAIAANTKSPAIGLRLAMHPKRKNTNDNVHISYLADSTCVVQIGDVYFDMKYVKGGTFMMGQADEEKPAVKNARPQHEVTLSDYYIGETEVTEQLWNAIIGTKSNTTDLPKMDISFFDCVHFIIQLNKITGKKFSLPTEAEWEFAARGGKKRNGYKYAGSDNINHVAIYCDNTTRMRPIKQKLPNELGLYDMSGSVREWCKDKYSDYGSSVQVMSTSKSWSEPRVLRGGGYDDDAIHCSIIYRSSANPDFKSWNIGFRLILAIDDEFAE